MVLDLAVEHGGDASHTVRDGRHEVVEEDRGIVFTGAKRRKSELDDRQAMVEVAPERAIADLFLEIAPSGGYHTDICLDRTF